MRIRELTRPDLPWAQEIVSEHFGSPQIVSRGRLHDSRDLPGLVAELDGKPAGLLQYQIEEDQCEVVILISLLPRKGIGRELLLAAEAVARRAGCARLWLTTTNNNRGAIALYKAVGWQQVAIYHGSVREARKIKPEIPLYDGAGVPIEDEIEFERQVIHE